MSKSFVQVILLHNFPKIGGFGDKKKVKRGYARNYLLPNKFAIYATKENDAKFDLLKKEALERSNELKDIAVKLAERISCVKISIVRNSALDGKIYGTVSSRDIVNEFKKNDIMIERSCVILNDKIQNLGVYKINFNLHPDVVLIKEIYVVGDNASVSSFHKEDFDIGESDTGSVSVVEKSDEFYNEDEFDN